MRGGRWVWRHMRYCGGAGVSRIDREGPIHRAILHYLRVVLPGAIIHHSASEGVRGGKAGYLDGAKRKGMGQVSGFPDILALTEAGPLFFEVKAEGSYASPAQKAMHGQLAALGYSVAVVRSVEDVREVLAAWGVATREAAE
mgnify:CR=1 FL=1